MSESMYFLSKSGEKLLRMRSVETEFWKYKYFSKLDAKYKTVDLRRVLKYLDREPGASLNEVASELRSSKGVKNFAGALTALLFLRDMGYVHENTSFNQFMKWGIYREINKEEKVTSDG